MRYKRNLIRGALCCAVALGLLTGAHAATLSVDRVEAESWATAVPVAIRLDAAAGEQVSGIQMDLRFDGSRLVLTGVQAGAAATNAGKTVSYNAIASGVVRIVITGLNRTAMADGVVASPVFDVSGATAGLTYGVTLNNLLVTSPEAIPVSTQAEAGSISVAAPDDTPSPGGCFGWTQAPPPGTSHKNGLLVVLLTAAMVLAAGRRLAPVPSR